MLRQSSALRACGTAPEETLSTLARLSRCIYWRDSCWEGEDASSRVPQPQSGEDCLSREVSSPSPVRLPFNSSHAFRESSTNASFAGSTRTLSPIASSSAGNRFATHPVTATSGCLGRLAARRTALRVLAWASPVTAQVLIAMMSASSSAHKKAPDWTKELSIQSDSTRLTRQPRLTTQTCGAMRSIRTERP